MERAQALTVENFISNWNGDFPNYPLTAADLKKPHNVMGALFLVFDRLGIDRDVVLAPPPEESRNDHTVYYWDLLPVINMTRVINHLVSVMPHVDATISITHFLQPMATTSHSILLLLFNLMVFNDERLRDIAPAEEELFARTDQVKILEDRKNRLLEMLNEQAEEKGKREERLEKLNEEIKQYEEELKLEKDTHDQDKQELEVMLKENHQIEVVLEQKKGLRDVLLAEVARKRALRVYDADDIKAQAEQAAQNVQEAEEKLNLLRTTLMEKEASLKNLQTIKPCLDTANNLLHEIMKLSESLKESSEGDLEVESSEGEVDVLGAEVRELEGQLQELRGARARAGAGARGARATRLQDQALAESALREAEENDKTCRERCKRAQARADELKRRAAGHAADRTAGADQLARIRDDFTAELKTMEEALLEKTMEVQKRVEDKMRNRNL